MQRITKDHLNSRLALLHRLLGIVPGAESYRQPGVFYVDHSNGGCRVGRISNSGGGSHDVQQRRGTKREAYDFLGALIDGVQLGRDGAI